MNEIVEANLNPPTLLKVTLLYGCFSRFLIRTNGAKSRNASHTFIDLLFHGTGFFLYSLKTSENLPC